MSQARVRQLTSIQIKAAQGLASGLSQGEAAAAAGASRRSVVRWLSDPLFSEKVSELKDAVYKVEVEIVESATRDFSLEKLIYKAKKVVNDVLDDPDARDASKLKAADLIGKWASLREQPSVEEDDTHGFPGEAYLKQRKESGNFLESDLSHLSDEELKALYFKSLSEDYR
jgi:hypothetical protein